MPQADAMSLARRQNGGSANQDNPVMFAVLLVFLGAFMVFLAGGISWHAFIGRRRSRLLAALTEMQLAAEQVRKPALWDVWADRTESKARLSGPAEWRAARVSASAVFLT
jgi:hypothetical protein